MLSADRQNNFGVLRLVFASLVICYHSYFLIDGDAHRDIFHKLCGVMPLGTLAVDGFFLISGYLIVQSYSNSQSIKVYLVKRFVRIWPAYAVAFLISLLVVAPIGGAKLADVSVPKNILHFLTFQEPYVDRVFHGLAQERVNGSMWTIAYELRCYVLVVLLGACGLLRNRRMFLAMTICIGIAGILPNRFALPFPSIFGTVGADLFFMAAFCAGGLFYLYRDQIKLRLRYAALALPIFFALQLNDRTAQIGVMTAGAYVLFWVANYKGNNAVSRFTGKTDLSYGIYLYAYPVQQLILWRDRSIDMYDLMALSMAIAWVLGAISWYVIERPALRLRPRSVQSKLAPVGPPLNG